jgi:hypothetical protein
MVTIFQPFVASHNKVICGSRLGTYLGQAGCGVRSRSPLIDARFGGCVVFSASSFQRRGLHDSLTYTSIIQFCVSTRAVRWCRWASFESPSFLFIATGRRSSIGFRPYRRTPTGVVSRSLQSPRPRVRGYQRVVYRKKASKSQTEARCAIERNLSAAGHYNSAKKCFSRTRVNGQRS